MAGWFRFDVSSYAVDVAKGSGKIVRVLSMEAGGSSTADADHVVIRFYDKEPKDLGTFDPGGGGVDSSIYCNLHISYFNDIYHVLQTEKPVRIGWLTQGNTNDLDHISIGTFEEPIGEGPADST